MSSITTSIPTGVLEKFCFTSYDSDPHDPAWDLCLNDTKGHEADWQTICCDGELISNEVALWGSLTGYDEPRVYRMEEMVCCRQAGRNPGGLLPLDAYQTECASGEPTPLASLAATNTDNAQNFRVTYISASAGTADWTTRSSASCMWINTKSPQSMIPATLPVPVLTTLPPESTRWWGEPDITDSFSVVDSLSGAAPFGISNSTARSTDATSSDVGSSTAAPVESVTSAGSASPTATAENAASMLFASKSAWGLALLTAPTLFRFVLQYT